MHVIKIFQVYSGEPTGTSMQWNSEKSLSFPALSVCDNHYDYRRVHKDLNFPGHILTQNGPQVSQTNPLVVYRGLDLLAIDDVTHGIPLEVLPRHQGLLCSVNEHLVRL